MMYNPQHNHKTPLFYEDCPRCILNMAAPELLEACEEAAPYLNNSPSVKDRQLAKMLSAAIQKAKPKEIALLRQAGCKCPKPLIGHRPGKGPRCRLCNVEAKGGQ